MPLALAFSRLAEDFPDAALVFVGSNTLMHPTYVDGAEEVLRRLELPEGRIRIEPATRRVHEWFAISDAMVLASDNESMPRVLLEAMAFGLPVLATRIFGIPELIEDGANGLLCEPQDLDSLEQGLRRLLALDPAELAAINESADATVRPSRDSAAYAEKVRGIFDRLLAGSKESSGNLLG